MKKFILSLALVAISLIGYAQIVDSNFENPVIKRHSVFVELGGNSLIYSLNYDYSFATFEKLTFNTGLGVSYFNVSLNAFPEQDMKDRLHLPIFTPQINMLSGKEKHYFEYGLFYSLPLNNLGVRAGYRYQPNEGGFLFRSGFTPMLLGGGLPIPWLGVSFGYTF